jgi:2-keto-4-pentenoate hydratase/2-oxohepta-3-ene-1,7-dioic acid hydratase in catechol pathway
VRIASYQFQGRRQVGQVSLDGQSVRAFEIDAGQAERGALALIDRSDWRSTPLQAQAVAIGQVKLQSPIPRPKRNVFCVGRNYHEHARELRDSVFKNNNTNVAAWPIVFTKVPECVVGPHDEVILPHGISEQIDYESELAVVIGTGGKNIRKEDALKHIFGYTIVNDVTARDVQMRHQQWDMGKSFDTFCPMGPWIVTADELDGTNTRVRGWVNGQLRQDGRTTDLIFDIATLIETCSRGITLYPGDVIATGTPAGVGMGMNPPQYLKSGDVVRVEIDGIGAIENRFV